MDNPNLNSELASVVVLNGWIEDGYEPCTGICNAICGYGEYLSPLVKRAAPSWPAYSGDRIYPVPVELEGRMVPSAFGYEESVKSGTLWKGAQGFLRRSLLRHCIDQAVLESGIY